MWCIGSGKGQICGTRLGQGSVSVDGTSKSDIRVGKKVECVPVEWNRSGSAQVGKGLVGAKRQGGSCCQINPRGCQKGILDPKGKVPSQYRNRVNGGYRACKSCGSGCGFGQSGGANKIGRNATRLHGNVVDNT